MNRKYAINIIFPITIIFGYFFIDKNLAIFFHKYFLNTSIYNIGVFIGSFTSSLQIRFLALIIGLTAAFKICKGNKTSAQKYAFVFLSFFISYFIAFALKYTLARYRPEILFNSGLYGFHFFSTKRCFTSFPSGHTVSSFSIAFAFLYTLKNKKLITVFFILALIIGLCRIIICAHFFTDVLTSIYISYLTTYFLKKYLL